MELSTIMPIPTTRPPKLIKLIVMPNTLIKTKAANTDKGMETATIIAARQSPKNSSSTNMEIANPCSREETTFMIFS